MDYKMLEFIKLHGIDFFRLIKNIMISLVNQKKGVKLINFIQLIGTVIKKK